MYRNFIFNYITTERERESWKDERIWKKSSKPDHSPLILDLFSLWANAYWVAWHVQDRPLFWRVGKHMYSNACMMWLHWTSIPVPKKSAPQFQKLFLLFVVVGYITWQIWWRTVVSFLHSCIPWYFHPLLFILSYCFSISCLSCRHSIPLLFPHLQVKQLLHIRSSVYLSILYKYLLPSIYMIFILSFLSLI